MHLSLPYFSDTYRMRYCYFCHTSVAAFCKQDFLTFQQTRDAIIFQGLQEIPVVDPLLSIKLRTREEQFF